MYKEIFHIRIKEARIKTGFTQVEVEKETGISQAILSRIETGDREPNIENLGTLAEFYQVNTDWLLGIGKYNNKKA